MRHLFILYVALWAITSITSCSSEETPEEQLLGSWTGSILEADYGYFQADIIFTKVSIDGTNASISYGVNDKSVCDNDIYFCDIPSESCMTTWTYKGFNSGSYSFFEEPIGDHCVAGNITLTFQSDNVLSYRFVGSEFPDITASGVLNRNE